ncbi:MAG: LLM class flavin-dependent oxidoreductase [Chloroflexota bacterium]
MIALSVLDQSPIRSGRTPADAIRETVELAQAADRLGYRRYWLAEHHSSEGLAGSAPEILIGQVAARTSQIRVGSGGVMLSHYSALKVAESFRVLETLYPGRIDLGIGRAPGSDRQTSMALAHGPGALPISQFPGQVRDVIDWLHDAVEPGHTFAGVKAMPVGPSAPEVWLLGSSADSATYAAHFGTAFSFAHFINPNGGDEITRMYRGYFQPSEWLAEPKVSVGVFVICADTEAEALRLRKSRDLAMARRYTGGRGPFPTVAEAESHLWTDHQLAIVEYQSQRVIAGSPEQVRERLLTMADEYEADEFVVVTITEDEQTRLHSYELLAEAFELPGRE